MFVLPLLVAAWLPTIGPVDLDTGRQTDVLIAEASVKARLLYCRSFINELLGQKKAAQRDREAAEEHLAVMLTHRPTGQRYLQESRAALRRPGHRAGITDPLWEPVSTSDLARARARLRHSPR
jgi:hypothetical protein